MTKRKDKRPISLLKRPQFRDAGELGPDQALAKAYIRERGTALGGFTVEHEEGCPKYPRVGLIASVACTCDPKLFDGDGEWKPSDE